MLDEMMVRYCAPTLAGIKTGNLMNCTCADRESFLETVNNMAQRLASRGICVMPFTMPMNTPDTGRCMWMCRKQRGYLDSIKVDI